MVSEVAVGDGDGGGAHNDVDEAILAVGHGNVVDPNVGRSEDRDAVTVALCPDSDMIDGVPDVATTTGGNVMNVKIVDDDVLHKLNRDASTVGDADVGTAGVDGLVTSHYELLRQPDDHAAGEDDPQRLLLDDGVPERPRLRVHEVVV